MTETGTPESIIQAMEERGWAARFVPADRRFDLWSELEGRFGRGELDEALFGERVKRFEEPIKNAPTWVRSILLVAIPDVAMRIRFSWQGREVTITVPPTFIHGEERGEPCVEAFLKECKGTEAIRTGIAYLPKKLLATRSGLARYGRNNITYVEGMGSYHRLSSLYTDIPCEDGTWQEPSVLDSCESCGACLRACPVGAIDPERFMVHAERCITFSQEKPGDVPYAEEFDFSWQDQFIGCMRCQTVCPHNQGILRAKEAGPPFTEEETNAFLCGAAAEELSEETIEKLKQHDILEYLEVLPRNLPASLQNASLCKTPSNRIQRPSPRKS
ncbi:4Fe-4S double cluster binding domain-containing protein [Candidatus Bipolaricaulota bacterium]